jgi:peptide/nickel transport system substrate-binding protein
MEGYWARFSEHHISRRRAIQAMAGAGAGAALLAACGGGPSKSGTSSAGESSLLATKVDTTKQAVAGGTWQDLRTEDVVTFDPLTNDSTTSFSEMLMAYSLLVKHGFGLDRPVGAADIAGDAAESWEISPDAQQVTFKVRPNHKFDARPPTSGRAMNAADVKYSWDKAANLSPYRGNYMNNVNPASPITSVSTPDDRTVVFKLAFPYASFLELVAHNQHPYVMPVEAEGKFDPRQDMRGSGPFMMTNYVRSARFEYQRNPDWYVKGRPFFDGISRPILNDYAAGLAQFETKAVWNFAVRQEDVLRVKRDHAQMLMYQDQPPSGFIATSTIKISQQPASPLRDVRVRRAASMLIDREAALDALNNLEAFRSQGLPVKTLWDSHLAAGFPSWIDPQTNDLGEGAKYFKHDVAEAKKLMLAAGYKDPVTLPYSWFTLRPAVDKLHTVISSMFVESGLFKINAEILDYNTSWRQVCQASHGDGYFGFCHDQSDGFSEDSFLVALYTPTGKFAVSNQALPEISDLVVKTRTETDATRRSNLVKDIQRRLALEMPDIPTPGSSLGYTLRWPWLKNHGVFNTGGASARVFTEHWYDATAKT